jgi:hypothetical protein
MLAVAPVVAVAAGTVGFVLANDLDLPPAQVTVALLCLVLLLLWGALAVRRGYLTIIARLG